MAIIATNINDGKNYIIVGCGFNLPTPKNPVFLMSIKEQEGVVAVCDESGKIFWMNSSELEVVEVDGILVEELLL
ncbi:MAG: hypothetical protein N4A54_05590 [Peptostreptococcaceae bacterium]|jgi:hypothetical protein|nr:hypothetical protein [Peptostreptococcaceae bacterium]